MPVMPLGSKIHGPALMRSSLGPQDGVALGFDCWGHTLLQVGDHAGQETICPRQGTAAALGVPDSLVKMAHRCSVYGSIGYNRAGVFCRARESVSASPGPTVPL